MRCCWGVLGVLLSFDLVLRIHISLFPCTLLCTTDTNDYRTQDQSHSGFQQSIRVFPIIELRWMP